MEPRNLLFAAVGILVCWNSILTHQYAKLWTHPLPVWVHAARMAPLKPRPWMNVAIGMVMVNNIDAAERAINLSEAAAAMDHTLPWDRAATTEIVAKNRAVISNMRKVANASAQ